MGNTEMTKYMAAGAFADLTSKKASFANSANWLKGLAASGVFSGKTYGVPYYAGSRVVTYRTDLFKKAGIKKLPTSLAEYTADARKLAAKNKREELLPRLHRRHRLVRRDELRLRLRRPDRNAYRGKWVGTLDRPQASQGLAAYKKFFRPPPARARRRSRRSRTRTTSTPRATRPR